MKYFRKRRAFRRTYRRRAFRKFPRPGTKRFFKRQRRLPKPEIKWVDFVDDIVALPQTLPSITTRAQPLAIPQGVTANTRIGKSIKARKIITNIYVVGRPVTGSGAAPTALSYDSVVRVVFWTPVTTASIAVAYINGTTPYTTPLQGTAVFDWNIIKVHRDVTMKIGSSNYITANNGSGTATPFVNAAQPNMQFKKFMIPFPRNIEFSYGDNLDVDRYTMYVTFFHVLGPGTNFPLACRVESKMTFIDA